MQDKRDEGGGVTASLPFILNSALLSDFPYKVKGTIIILVRGRAYLKLTGYLNKV